MIETDHLNRVAREGLGYLRGDLQDARRSAIGDQCAIQCDHIKERSKALTPLVGPTPSDEIQIPLLEDGVYRRIHADLGVEVTVGMERVSHVQAGLNPSRTSA
ncbi:hypothetical protein ACIQM3_07610 [Streptomyces sp. NPDC091271]|uniref:hypothetical protein n=1 Tax=Streptomyces sp. NPDC091271 TaxID=3365980 RepID=UPI00381C536C